MKLKAFTLAELLIALAILGVIATFTIPKVLTANQNQQYNAMAKEAVSTISQAYQQAKLDGGVTPGYNVVLLTQYMNYVALDTVGTVDDIYGSGTSVQCSNTWLCVKLHNGGKLLIYSGNFVSGASTNLTFMLFDPDGRYTDATTNGPAKPLKIALYYDGFITSRANVRANSQDSSGGTFSPGGGDPPWFSWN